MGRVLPPFALVLALACEPSAPVPSDEPAPAEPAEVEPCPEAARLDELLQQLDAELRAQGIPGGAAAIACKNGHVAAGGVGVTEVGTDAPVSATTRFQIASITKSFTAATAIRVEEDGQLDRAAPLAELLPTINTAAPYETSFTLAQLLAHTAGYPTEIADGNFALWGLAEFFEGNADVPLWSPPGRVWNYANYGYGLAGYALERATGQLFGDLVEERLFAAAGMTGASMSATDVAAEGEHAIGHTGSAAQPVRQTPLDSYYDAGWYGPMGGAWCSAEDLARFAALLLDDAPDAPFAGVRAAMTEKRLRTDSAPDVFYGQGLFLDESGTAPVWSHGGGVAGFLSDMQIFPEAGVAVVVLVNADWGFPQGTLSWAAGELGQRQPIEEWGELVAADVVGTYEDDLVLGTVVVTEEAGGLRATFEDLGFATELWPYDTDTAWFAYEPWDYEMSMTFWRDAAGDVDLLSTMAGVASRSE